MKKIDILCASQTATAILCSSTTKDNSPSSTPSSSSTFLLTGGAIDRYNPIIRDPKRTPKLLTNYSATPTIPKPQTTHHKNNNKEKKKKKKIVLKENEDERNKGVVKKSWKCTNPGDFISPPGSTRYLLREKFVLDASSGFDPKLSLDEEFLFEDKQASESQEQVVALRVSLHCRGCERKLRKHLSRMEGVTSYSIEFAAKKVTVTGNVTPQGVLASICKVKNAQLWSPVVSSTIPSTTNLTNSTVENDCKGLGLLVG